MSGLRRHGIGLTLALVVGAAWTPATLTGEEPAAEELRGVLAVEDSGPGIPPEERERVFAPFYRGQTGARFPQGMGLGLSIARDLVAAHGGSIRVESEPGEGSVFEILLPRAEAPADAAPWRCVQRG